MIALQDRDGNDTLEERFGVTTGVSDGLSRLQTVLMDQGLLEQTKKLPVVVDVSEPATEDPLKKIHHSVVFPYGYDIPKDPADKIYTCEPPAELPVKFPYELDPFQRRAIGALHIGHSVLVAAHTSAGKTTVAEYIIATALAQNQRVVYTTPIKALSNQKYQDLKLAAYTKGSVGIMTGDTTLNRTAGVLVMTTEILRNMLHQGAELLREIGYVIFDEVHYMRNSERGLVWEDCIAMLSSNIQFCFLSATVPNASEFAGWVASLHSIPVHVVYTQYRPVPLMHFLCPVGGDGIYPICSSIDKNKIRHDQVIKAKANLPHDNAQAVARGEEEGTSGHSNKKQQQKAIRDTLHRVMKNLIARDCFPLIVFAFGKKKCEAYAMDFIGDYFSGGQRVATSQSPSQRTHGEEPQTLAPRNDQPSTQTQPPIVQSLVTPEQTRIIDNIFDAALKCLPEEDRNLRPVVVLRGMLRRGIAVHHSGLLPWAKEIIEILFVEGLVKILYATETFAMGLNLPARAIIFSEFKKFDGLTSRLVTAGEYVQMAGRAGRRGIDKQGMSICMFSTADECDNIVKVIQGTTEPLNSAYRLSFNSVLKLMQIEDSSPEQVIKRSFLQFQQLFRLPRCLNKILSLEDANTMDKAQLFALLLNIFSILQRLSKENEQLAQFFGQDMLHSLEMLAVGDIQRLYDLLTEYINLFALRASYYADRSRLLSQDSMKQLLIHGRIVHVHADGLDMGWVPVLKVIRSGADSFVDCLVPCSLGSVPAKYTNASESHLIAFSDTVPSSLSSQGVDKELACAVLVNKSYYQTYTSMLQRQDGTDVAEDTPTSENQPPVKKRPLRKVGSKPDQRQKVSHADINDLIYANDCSESITPQTLYEYSFIDPLQPFVRENKASYQMLAPRDILLSVLTAINKCEASSKKKQMRGKLHEHLWAELASTACVIVRIPVRAIRGVSGKILKSLPENMYRYDDKSEAMFLYYQMIASLIPSDDSHNFSSTLADLMEPHINLSELAYSDVTSEVNELECNIKLVEHAIACDTEYGILTRIFSCPAYHMPVLHRVLNAIGSPAIYAKISTQNEDANGQTLEEKQLDIYKMVKEYLAGSQDEGASGQMEVSGMVFSLILNCMRRDAKKQIFKQYIQEADELILSSELIKLKNFLHREHFIEEIPGAADGEAAYLLTDKGRVACHVSSANEVILVECLFEAQFTDLTPRVLAGVLASLLGEGTGASKSSQLQMDPKLSQALSKLKQIVSNLLKDCAIEDTTLELRCTTVDHIVDDTAAVIAFSWAAGQTFQEILDIDRSQFEGSIVRMFRRLINLVDQLVIAVEVIGDDRLKARLTAVHDAIFRDIIKVNSLYVVAEDDV